MGSEGEIESEISKKTNAKEKIKGHSASRMNDSIQQRKPQKS